jgi:hypothetical protein
MINELFEKHKKDYLVYRGSSFHKDTGELMWAKDDAMAYAEGIDEVIKLIKERMPKPKTKSKSRARSKSRTKVNAPVQGIRI